MIENRFTFEIKTKGNKAYTQWYDNGKPINSAETIVDLLNELADENQFSKEFIEQLQEELVLFKEAGANMSIDLNAQITALKQENEQLKQTIKEVLELLKEEVDLFSDKAIEHDIQAYIELGELDNKDAYYMAISTKKAIKLLKEVEE